MAFYHYLNSYVREDLSRLTKAEKAAEGILGPAKAKWIAEGLLRLRQQIRDSELGKRQEKNLVIGSWNIRACDEGTPRRDESYHYIAEIIDHFDICALQEVKDDLKPLWRLKEMLGPNWNFFVTDPTAGNLGNRERLAFFWNENKVLFRNLVGEVVLAQNDLIDGERQFARTPFLASFQSGWFKFTLASVHIIFGGSRRLDKAQRAAEVKKLAEICAKRAKKDDQFYAMIGDMNIETTDDDIMAGLTKNGLEAPAFGGTNLKLNRAFDQIAFTTKPRKARMVGHGVVDWRHSVYRPEDADIYRPIAEADRDKPYRNWTRSYENSFMSFEMSDHLPIWVEVETDYSDDYLRRFTK
ncbi:MAG: endonuclease/exonuclease/phosphatase family protein [Pseudomonadota bacterium]